ncbi:hypothetical protein [Glutamicibacter protophormiae]|uniref:Uncharacterized protein n=1 Tax=Glutamicibacter protophormiae TaxID=37930 RepID=A0ABS4XTI4_GLUPR|nr:hypothetical protein [Glutamicibacter protophormiae]MBP2399790.1 hypothetical protein [Glutamicibacter protophormiae]GGL89175.1 hypothetical protein GCM10010038_18990 [Glutamicibacter protophormiae]
MASIDINAIVERKNARIQRRENAIQWIIQAISEFPEAVRVLNMPTYGNPDFFERSFGKEWTTGIYPILRTGDSSNILIDVGHGFAMTGNGTFWVQGKASDSRSAAIWLGARTGFSIDLLEKVFADALLGDSWTVQQSLNSAPQEP